ncbi:hypothetical protein K466DRAFT_505649, partial [Polyporus arcularius HHB13444]
NGENPVVSDLAMFIANSMPGSFCAQSRWSGRTHCRSICVIVRFALSVAPSVCGW